MRYLLVTKLPTKRNPLFYALAALQRIRQYCWAPRVAIKRKTFRQLALLIGDFRDEEPGYGVESAADVTRLANDYGFVVKRLGNVVEAVPTKR